MIKWETAREVSSDLNSGGPETHDGTGCCLTFFLNQPGTRWLFDHGGKG
jgi:hypothetical protein